MGLKCSPDFAQATVENVTKGINDEMSTLLMYEIYQMTGRVMFYADCVRMDSKLIRSNVNEQ